MKIGDVILLGAMLYRAPSAASYFAARATRRAVVADDLFAIATHTLAIATSESVPNRSEPATERTVNPPSIFASIRSSKSLGSRTARSSRKRPSPAPAHLRAK